MPEELARPDVVFARIALSTPNPHKTQSYVYVCGWGLNLWPPVHSPTELLPEPQSDFRCVELASPIRREVPELRGQTSAACTWCTSIPFTESELREKVQTQQVITSVSLSVREGRSPEGAPQRCQWPCWNGWRRYKW